jgi:DNA replication protein DnaC
MPFTAGTIRWHGSPRPSIPSPLLVDAHNRDAMQRVTDSIERDGPIVLLGAVGAGKTTLMAQIDAEFSRKDPAPSFTSLRRYWLSEPNWWTTAEGYVQDVRQGWDFAKQFPDWGPDYSADGIAPRVKRLFLDDLGVESERENANEIVSKLLRDRYAAGLSTWVTTNLEIPDLSKRYGERVISRLMEQAAFVRVEGKDRRVPMNRRARVLA